MRPLPQGQGAFRAVFATIQTVGAGADGPGLRRTGSLQSASAAMSASDLQQRLDEALSELEQLRAENERLRTLLALAQGTQAIIDRRQTREAPPASLGSIRCFRGREGRADPAPLSRPRDVYALRWENARTGKSGYVPATAGGWTKTGPKTYLPLSDEAIERHLRGRESIGVYPLLEDDTLLVSRLRLRRQDVAARRARPARGVR